MLLWLARAIGWDAKLSSPPHKPVSHAYFRFHKGPLAQIFYPYDVNSNYISHIDTQHALMREEALEGLAKGMKLSKYFFLGPLAAFHPLPLEKHPILNENGKKLPLVIMSPGLWGNCEIYTHLCKDIASYGYVVIALEHEDGSSSYAKTHENEDVYYNPPPAGFVYERDAVIEFRSKFIEHRVKEIKAVLAHLDKIVYSTTTSTSSTFTSEKNPAIINEASSFIDLDSIFLCGHSFGACTGVACAHDLELKQRILGLVLLDVWSFPIPRPFVEQGITLPCVSVLSDVFAHNGEVAITKNLIENSTDSVSFYIPETVHQSFSDSAFWGPQFLTRMMQTSGNLDRDVTQEAIIECSTKFMEAVLKYRDLKQQKISLKNIECVKDIVLRDTTKFNIMKGKDLIIRQFSSSFLPNNSKKKQADLINM